MAPQHYAFGRWWNTPLAHHLTRWLDPFWDSDSAHFFKFQFQNAPRNLSPEPIAPPRSGVIEMNRRVGALSHRLSAVEPTAVFQNIGGCWLLERSFDLPHSWTSRISNVFETIFWLWLCFSWILVDWKMSLTLIEMSWRLKQAQRHPYSLFVGEND